MTQAETDILFQLKNVSYTYSAVNTPPFAALKKINLTVRKGEFIAVIGPSGSGKSTLMHLLGIMADPTGGELLVKGQPAENHSADGKAALRNSFIGFLFQQFFLLPQLTVLENILLPSEYQAAQEVHRIGEKRAFELIGRFGLTGQEYKKPANLSGGQRQRVALCRALIMNPEVLLCDEPTGALDSQTAKEVLNTLAELHAGGRTIVVITHDPEVARRAHRIVRIADGQIISDSVQPKGTDLDPVPQVQIQNRTAGIPKTAPAEHVARVLSHLFVPTWQALQTHRLRTALTMTGLLLGVSSVFIMLTLTGRVSQIFEDFFATQGSRKAFVSFDGRLADRTGAPRWRGLNVITDLPKLNAQLKPLGRLDPNVETGGCKILSPSANIQGSLTGLNSLQEVRENDLRIAAGRLPLPHEFESGTPNRIAVLGSDAALKLFPANAAGGDVANHSPAGQNIIVRGCEFEGILRVVGVVKPVDSLFDRGVNSTIYLPATTLLAGGASIYKTHFTAVPSAGISPTGFAKHVIGKLSVMTANQFPFRYFAAEKELEKFNLMMGILTGLTLVIGGLCTLIGGIGVMNIMLVNVHERVQEIGIRKAVGARERHIRWQFLLESTGLCLISGCLGLAVGIAASTAALFVARMFLPQVENLSFKPDPVAMAVALSVSLGAGLVFGTWPARKAAALDVVEALKQE